MECVQASFEGYPIRLARRAGGEACIFAEDSLEGIGSDMLGEMRSIHDSLTFVDSVVVDGVVRPVRLLTRSDFLMVCLKNRSPRLDNFRRNVVTILEQIEETGRYDSRPAPGATLPADLANDPIISLRVRQIEHERRLSAVEERVGRVDEARSLAIEARQIALGEDGFLTLSEFAARKGFCPSQEVLKVEGSALAGRLRGSGRGNLIAREKRNPGAHNSHWVNAYRITVLDSEWWPDFARRMGYGD